MAVYVDSASLAWRGKRWCHLVANSVDELHQFARRLGLKPEWFQSPSQYPHYDVTLAVREKALRLGALEGDKQTIVDCCTQVRMELKALRRAAQGTGGTPSNYRGELATSST